MATMTTQPSLHILDPGDVPRTMAGIGVEWVVGLGPISTTSEGTVVSADTMTDADGMGCITIDSTVTGYGHGQRDRRLSGEPLSQAALRPQHLPAVDRCTTTTGNDQPYDGDQATRPGSPTSSVVTTKVPSPPPTPLTTPARWSSSYLDARRRLRQPHPRLHRGMVDPGRGLLQDRRFHLGRHR